MLVQVHAAGLNQLDEKIRLGEFKQILPYKLQLVLGNDVAGTVLASGQSVEGFKPGDEVYARPRTKTASARSLSGLPLRRKTLALKPASVTMEEAGSLPLVALTAWQALVEQGNVRPGQKVLIHAGAGGVGSIAIQLAKHLGATVATTASSSNAGFVRDLGADVVIDYRTQDFEQLLSGYDLVLDSLGGKNLQKVTAHPQTRREGDRNRRPAGSRPSPASQASTPCCALRSQDSAAGSAGKHRKLGVSYEFLFMRASGDQLRQISALVDAGVLRPVVGKVFTFGQAPEALQSLAAGGFRGKAVLTVTG